MGMEMEMAMAMGMVTLGAVICRFGLSNLGFWRVWLRSIMEVVLVLVRADMGN